MLVMLNGYKKVIVFLMDGVLIFFYKVSWV